MRPTYTAASLADRPNDACRILGRNAARPATGNVSHDAPSTEKTYVLLRARRASEERNRLHAGERVYLQKDALAL